MRLHLVAVGKAKAGPERDLFVHYVDRIKAAGPAVALGPLSLIEVEPRKRLEGADLRRAEADLILAAIPERASVIALDERGKSPDSKAFSADLCARRDSGTSDLAFVIGGADGLDPSIRQRADRLIALGAMTWPHLLVRALVAEQVYRAITIAAGHPYHRE